MSPTLLLRLLLPPASPLTVAFSFRSYAEGGVQGLGSQHGPSAGGRGRGGEEGLQEEGPLAQMWPLQGAQRRWQVQAGRGGREPPCPGGGTKAVLYFGSVQPPHEDSRQRSCSAPNLRRSPRHSPAVPGVPSLVESGNAVSSFLTVRARWRLREGQGARETRRTRPSGLVNAHVCVCVCQHGKRLKKKKK